MTIKLTDWLINYVKARTDHLEMMAAAYLKITQIDPRNVELVEESDGAGPGSSTRWYFRQHLPEKNECDALRDRLTRTEDANVALRRELENVKRMWRESIDRDWMPIGEKLPDVGRPVMVEFQHDEMGVKFCALAFRRNASHSWSIMSCLSWRDQPSGYSAVRWTPLPEPPANTPKDGPA